MKFTVSGLNLQKQSNGPLVKQTEKERRERHGHVAQIKIQVASHFQLVAIVQKIIRGVF